MYELSQIEGKGFNVKTTFNLQHCLLNCYVFVMILRKYDDFYSMYVVIKMYFMCAC